MHAPEPHNISTLHSQPAPGCCCAWCCLATLLVLVSSVVVTLIGAHFEAGPADAAPGTEPLYRTKKVCGRINGTEATYINLTAYVADCPDGAAGPCALQPRCLPDCCPGPPR